MLFHLHLLYIYFNQRIHIESIKVQIPLIPEFFYTERFRENIEKLLRYEKLSNMSTSEASQLIKRLNFLTTEKHLVTLAILSQFSCLLFAFAVSRKIPSKLIPNYSQSLFTLQFDECSQFSRLNLTNCKWTTSDAKKRSSFV